MRKFLLIFFVYIVSAFAQNQAPLLVSLISPTGDNVDSILIPFQLADAENDLCTVSVSYSSDHGTNWFPATLANTVFQSNNDIHDTLVWASLDDLDIRDFGEVILKIIPHDSDTGDAQITTPFSVKNFTLRDFGLYFPATAIGSIAFNIDSTVNGVTDIAYSFTVVDNRVCSLALNYSIDNEVNWFHGASDITAYHNTSVTDTISWNTITDFPNYTGSTVSVKIFAQDTSSGRLGTAVSSGSFKLDNESPTYFWAGGIVDTNIVLLNFPDDIDTIKILDTARYTMNFGRKITAVHRNTNISSSVEISYAVQGGPENPDNAENLEVYYYSNLDEWVKVRTILPSQVINWTVFKDSITSIDAFHPLFKLRFIQVKFSGTSLDNYYLDDVILSKNGTIFFSDSITSSEISSLKWTVIENVVVDSDYVMSPPYSMKFQGSTTPREVQSAAFNEMGLETCGWYAETDFSLLPEVPYLIIIDTLFDMMGNFSLSQVIDTFSCRNDRNLPNITLEVPSPVLAHDAEIFYTLTDPDIDTLDITSIEYKVAGGQWQEATAVGDITDITRWNYKGSFTWRTNSDLPGQHIYNVSMRARVTDTTLEGNFDLLTDLEINNNVPPQISLNNISLPYSDTANIDFSITDVENDTIDLDIFFSNNKTEWFPARTTGTSKNITFSSYNDSFKWLTLEDVKHPVYEIVGVLYLKVTPKDYAFGSSKILEIPFNSSVMPVIELIDVSGEQHDTVTIPYFISDKDNSIITLVCKYSLDGINWHNATTTDSLTAITSANYAGFIKWLSKSDLPGIDNTSVYFKATPYDLNLGISSVTKAFHVDNNKLPAVLILPMLEETQTSDVPMSVVLSDYEFDTLDITFQYRNTDSSLWRNATIEETLYDYDSSEYNGKILTFTWNGSYDVDNYADSIWMRAAVTDKEQGAYSNSVGFYYSDKAPVLNISQIEDEQSGNVTIPFSIVSNSLDSITIEGCKYEINGSSWDPASIDGILKYPHDADSGVIIWKSLDDVGNKDYSEAKFRLYAVSHKTGPSAYSNYFSLNNNRSPSASLLRDAVVTLNKVYLKGLFGDYEYDRIKISLQYLEKSDSTWKYATVSEPTGYLDSADYNQDTIDITWKSGNDIDDDFIDTILVRLAALDNDTGSWDTLAFHFCQQAPDIILHQIKTEQGDTVSLPFNIVYEGTDSVSLSVKYSIDKSSWHSATLTEKTIFPGQTSKDTVKWLSNSDLPHLDIPEVWIRIKPSAKFNGVWKQNLPFHLDNNLPPQIYFTDETKNLEQNLLTINTNMSFTVSDSEYDTVFNTCLIRISSDTTDKIFELPENIVILPYEIYKDSSFSFKYFHDLYGDSIHVRFIISSADNDPGNGDTLSLLFHRFLGDFNYNGYVDLADLDIFIFAWKTEDFSKNTGPITGDFPNVSIIQDDKFDLEDLSAFVVSWNYTRKRHTEKCFKNTVYAKSEYMPEEKQAIYKADRDIFQIAQADSFSISNIYVRKVQPLSYIIQISLPDKDLLSGGFLLSFPENITIDSATGLSGDFAVKCYNTTGMEVLLYSTFIMSDYSPTKKTVKIYVRLKDAQGSMTMNVRYHATSKNKTAINKAASVNLNDIVIVSNDLTHRSNIKAVPNPFTPDITSLPGTIQKLTGKRYGNVIIVEKPEVYNSDYKYFISGRVSIYDMLGNPVVKEIPLSKDERGNLYFIWDGYNRNSRIVSNGSYKATIYTEDTINGELIHEILINVKR